MSYFEFKDDDFFTNTIETYPEYTYFIHSGTIFIDNHREISGSYSENIYGVPNGYVSLYEYNINRSENQRIYPFITKGGIRTTLRTVSDSDYNTKHGFGGEEIRGNYNLSASITRIPINNTARPKINALRNCLNHYSYMSKHYSFSSSLGNKDTQDINLINIPHILYGSQIKKGSMDLKYYLSGTLIGQLKDVNLNGELVQVGPYGSTGSGSVAGVVLYNEGLVLLTGSWDLHSKSITYDGASDTSKWYYFGAGANDNQTIDSTHLSASFSFDYKGVNKIETLNMFCHASYSDLNNSTNPTFAAGALTATSGSKQYKTNTREIYNIVSSSHTDVTPVFDRTTYISKIALYDKDKNLIGIAQVANPVRKNKQKQYTFKLKLDI